MGVKIREKPKDSGVWWLFISHNGKRKAKKIGKDKRLAREVAKKIEAKLVLGDMSLEDTEPPCPTFKEYSKMWLSLPHDFKESTRDEYRRKLRLHALPDIGKCRLNEIDKRRLQSLFNNLLLKGLARSTISVVKVAISEVLGHATEGDLIERNPVKDIKFKGSKTKKEIEALTDQEAALLLERAKEYLNGKYYPMMLTALRTGLRIGEMIALKWTDIDFENRLIEVKRSYVKKRMSSTKSGKIRSVDMTPLLAEVLKDLQTEQKRWALKTASPVPEFVFVTNKGKLELAESFRYALEKCLKNAGLKRIRIHDLRHTYATIRLLRGHNIGDISYQMGHSSIKITYDTYGHWIPGKFKFEVDELDQAQPNATYMQPDSKRAKN
jgi:integrase